MVGDHVVQLAGDALTLLEQRALARVPDLLLGELALAAAPLPDDGADQQRYDDRKTASGADPGSTNPAPITVMIAAAATIRGLQRTATEYRQRP